MIEVRIEDRVRVVTVSGSVTPQELLEYSLATVSSPQFDASMDSLVDLRDLDDPRISSLDVGESERIFAERTRGLKRRLALVVGSPVTLGYARAFQIQHSESGDATEIFTDLSDARRWLGMPAP